MICVLHLSEEPHLLNTKRNSEKLTKSQNIFFFTFRFVFVFRSHYAMIWIFFFIKYSLWSDFFLVIFVYFSEVFSGNVACCGPVVCRERKCDAPPIVHRRDCTERAHRTRRRAYLAITLYLLRPSSGAPALLILEADHPKNVKNYENFG